jgi:hypothetical protein
MMNVRFLGALVACVIFCLAYFQVDQSHSDEEKQQRKGSVDRPLIVRPRAAANKGVSNLKVTDIPGKHLKAILVAYRSGKRYGFIPRDLELYTVSIREDSTYYYVLVAPGPMLKVRGEQSYYDIRKKDFRLMRIVPMR